MSIWYDVSGLYQWEGNFTGIQRVVYSLARELSVSDHTVRFFVYQPTGFQEVAYTELMNRVEERRRKRVIDANDTAQAVSIAKIRHKGMVVAKDLLRDTRLGKPLRKVYRNARSLYRSVGRSATTLQQPSIKFSSDDIVVVVDGNWQFDGYAELLAKAKAESSFQLIHFIHDIVAVKNPALVNKGADKIIGDYISKIIPLADIILTISESTKRDVEEFIKTKSISTNAKISTVILGEDFRDKGAVGSALQHAPVTVPQEKFILSVSTVEVRKNYLSLYYAYKLAAQEGWNLPHLVIVGKKGWMSGDVYNLLTNDPEVSAKTTILQGIEDEQLEWLYENCLFTVFPSFYEGWGLPVAESFSHGKVCISSNTSSMPEVGGDFAVYVSPYDTRDLAQAIRDLSVDNKLRAAKEAHIQKSYRSRTWKQFADQFLGHLTTLL